LTVQEKTQLCSLNAVRRGGNQDDLQLLSTLSTRFEIAARDSFVQLALFLPLLALCLLALFRERVPRNRDLAPVRALARLRVGQWRVVSVVGGTLIVLLAGMTLGGDEGPGVATANSERAAFNACTDGGPSKTYDVSAIDVQITLNRWGDHVDSAHMYALNANIPAIREFEAALEADRTLPDSLATARVSYGLRDDLIQPLVIRANLGECLRIHFTNTLSDGDPASLHILGLPHTVENAGSAVGNNPSTMADPGETITYEIPIPLNRNAERSYYFHDHGAGRRRQNMGLFGAIVAEPEGATYRHPETGQLLDTETGSGWEAVIVDPNLDGAPDGKSFREFVLLYHEIGDEAFTDLQDKDDKKLPLVDELAGVYRPGARAINYRSEPFRNRIAFDEEVNADLAGNGKSLGYASYPFGDPATPIPRSYVGEPVKTRLMHGGSEVFHVHHLHGGGDRWRRNPNADPNNDYWKGLTKVPDPNLTSIHLDSQSIGPGSSYNLEHECGSGGCQQGVGDFLFHCHIGHHYIAGMWSFWRVYGTEQTAETNMYGRPLKTHPDLFQTDNVFSDDEAASNTPPELGVSAGQLIGTIVDDGKMIVADADVSDPSTQIGVLEWTANMLPPAGIPIDAHDATVWNWTTTGDGSTLRIFGEPESAVAFPGWVSPTPGVRPEVLFNPKNARYTWPLFRPQVGARPPFSARHSGAPWLGEEMKEGRMDGLCAQNGVHPQVDIGPAVNRYYPISAITLPVPVTSDRIDPDGKIFVLNEHEDDVLAGRRPAEPLAIRSNVGDCTELLFTNKIPDQADNKFFSKQNIHNHFLQFDTQASDGVITGMSYEQSVRPYENEERTLIVPASSGETSLTVTNVDRLRPGIWLGVGLGEATCGTDDDGQPLPCTEVRKIVSIPDANTVVLDQPLTNHHAAPSASSSSATSSTPMSISGQSSSTHTSTSRIGTTACSAHTSSSRRDRPTTTPRPAPRFAPARWLTCMSTPALVEIRWPPTSMGHSGSSCSSFRTTTPSRADSPKAVAQSTCGPSRGDSEIFRGTIPRTDSHRCSTMIRTRRRSRRTSVTQWWCAEWVSSNASVASASPGIDSTSSATPRIATPETRPTSASPSGSTYLWKGALAVPEATRGTISTTRRSDETSSRALGGFSASETHCDPVSSHCRTARRHQPGTGFQTSPSVALHRRLSMMGQVTRARRAHPCGSTPSH